MINQENRFIPILLFFCLHFLKIILKTAWAWPNG